MSKPKTRELKLTAPQAKAFNAAVQRANSLREHLDAAVHAQNLALTMLGVDPETVQGYDVDTGTLTVADED